MNFSKKYRIILLHLFTIEWGYARYFATLYQKDVLGLVLLDPAHEDYYHYLPEELNKLRKIKLECV